MNVAPGTDDGVPSGDKLILTPFLVIGGGLGGGFTEAGARIEAFWFGVDISLITNIVDEQTD